MRSAKVLDHLRSNVIGYVCLVWLMTGTAVAATHLPAKSVGRRQLRTGAVTNSKLARGAVTASKVKTGSITGTQVAESKLGTVPRAAAAANAAHATNADTLGGLGPAAFQRRIAGACTGGRSIRLIAADGSVSCQSPPATDFGTVQKRVTGSCATGIGSVGQDGAASCTTSPVQKLVLDSSTASTEVSGPAGRTGFGYQLDCPSSGPKILYLIDFTDNAATLNWVYSTGTNVTASGDSLDGRMGRGFDFSAGRIEGQFVYSLGSEVVTLNLHAYTPGAGSGCEVRGTALVAGT